MFVGCVKLGGGGQVTRHGPVFGRYPTFEPAKGRSIAMESGLADFEVRQDRVRMRKRRTFTFWQAGERIGHVPFRSVRQGTEAEIG